jgi:hypothetical protein
MVRGDIIMSKTYLRNTIILLMAAFVITGWVATCLFLPLIAAIQNLSSGTKSAPIPNPGLAMTVASVAALIVSLAAVGFVIKGVARDQSHRWLWAILLVVGLIVLFQAAGITFATPKFLSLFRDMKL